MDWHQLIKDIPGAIYQFKKEADGRLSFPFISPIMTEWFGVPAASVAKDATVILSFIHPEDIDIVLTQGDEAAAHGKPRHFEFRIKKHDGSWIWLEAYERGKQLADGSLVRSGYLHDVTERRKRSDKIAIMAHTDMLTGLPNRAHFNELLEHNVTRATRKNRALAVLFIDLDKFKPVNDTHGHDVGDLLLMEVARRLSSTLRQGDIACRAGGDEFIALLNDLEPPEIAEAVATDVAERICAELARPFLINDLSLMITASIGVALFPEHSIKGNILIRLADQAMYRAKTEGRNCARLAVDRQSKKP
ncbi:sensor domain-containing diguanylate cyclase [Pseudidiomarina salinarum]|uniref:sensor domain-containing diguanylate cyclase n=1 Tax=Pseudidiomarina salinarum TaxID=435908 RepID=UPI000689882B|nr:sensor domain-containing diguanylate cyclase [Pseudidiomarina salinarum]RUO69130.1 sensor domain-containing diguanylate cyclase [Pseudidiomarina salinarum]